MKVYYAIQRTGGREPQFKHETWDSALTEAKRLAVQVGGEYTILKALLVVKRSEVELTYLKEDFYDGPMPF